MPKPKRAVLVTGTSTGLGRAIVKRLATFSEFEVIATVRREEDGASLQEECPEVDALLLDITNAGQIAEAAGELGEHLKERGLFALVNNAGVAVFGPVEHVPLEEWRLQFEVNVFGQVALTQAMLPLLRTYGSKHTTRSARVVMMGSIAGRIGQPMLTPYSASKAALSSLAEGMRVELRRQNVDVCVVEPGAIRSEIWRKAEEEVESIPDGDPIRELYQPELEAVVRHAKNASRDALPAAAVALAVEQCLRADHPDHRVLVGKDAKRVALAKRWLPDRWFHQRVLKRLKLG